MVFTYILAHRLMEPNRQLRGNHTHPQLSVLPIKEQRSGIGKQHFQYIVLVKPGFHIWKNKSTILSLMSYKDQLKINSKLTDNLNARQKTNSSKII